MTTFALELLKGQAGRNAGLPLGPGLDVINKNINGTQKGMIYSVGAGAKVGKSTLVDAAFVIAPYLYCLEHNIPIDIIYFSYEIDRISKEFDFAAHFMAYDFGIIEYQLPTGMIYKGETTVPMSSKLLRGRLKDDNDKLITLSDDIMSKLRIVYEKRIEPLFGEFNDDGEMIKPGLIQFFADRENPTGLRNHIMEYAKANGTFKYASFTSNKGGKKEKGQRVIGYTPNDPSKYVLIVTDHLRKLKLERGFQMKQNVDKFVEYSVEFRNWCNFTFIHIIHLNRSIADAYRMKLAGDRLYPTGDDFKDTGNLSEESDYVFTMMNPNDTKYNLDKHFGMLIRDGQGNPLYPLMRTIHLVESRHSDFPAHFRVNMLGNIKTFEKFQPLANAENYEDQV
jgi:hypothetical protein